MGTSSTILLRPPHLQLQLGNQVFRRSNPNRILIPSDNMGLVRDKQVVETPSSPRRLRPDTTRETRRKGGERLRCVVARRRLWLLDRLSGRFDEGFGTTARVPPQPIAVFMNTASTRLQLHGSTLRLADRSASDRILFRNGVNTPPPTTINNLLLRLLVQIVTLTSLSDPTDYGSGLRKFHLFCDLFHIPETDRLPTFFEILHSFSLWLRISRSSVMICGNWANPSVC